MQSKQERAALNAAWQAHPTVVAFHAAMVAHAVAERLKFDPAGMSAMADFCHGWLAEHGPLPDSGIKAG